MKTVTMRTHETVRIRTTDAASRDTLITPGMTVQPERGPDPKGNDLGVRLNGSGAPPKTTKVDAGVIWAGIEKGLGSLDASDLAEIKRRMAKFCAGTSEAKNAVGITASTSLDSMNDRNQDFWSKQLATAR